MSYRKPFGELKFSDVMPDKNDPKDQLLWSIAETITQRLAEKKAMDECFELKDRSFVAGKAPVVREPEYFISPKDGATLLVKVVEIPDPDLPGETRLVRQWIIVHEYKCARCENTLDMFGWQLEKWPNQPDKIVQCPHCAVYHWLEKLNEWEPDNA